MNINSEKVLCLDIDETLGSFGLTFLCYDIYTAIKIECNPILFNKYLNSKGLFRPGLKKFVKNLENFKKLKYIDKIVLYTSAKNTKDYLYFLKSCIETYCDIKKDTISKIYHRNKNSIISPDGATIKDLKDVVNNGDISMCCIIDDKPHNILQSEKCISIKKYVQNYDYLELIKQLPFWDKEYAKKIMNNTKNPLEWNMLTNYKYIHNNNTAKILNKLIDDARIYNYIRYNSEKENDKELERVWNLIYLRYNLYNPIQFLTEY